MKFRIVIKSDEKRLVYGEVYAPLRVDTDAESMTAGQIEKMAHGFLIHGLTDCIDVQHNFEKSGSCVVESFIARKGDPDGFVEGAWVLGVLITEKLWPAVKSGELNGFSFAGKPDRWVPAHAVVKIVRKLEGSTEKSAESELLPPHEHPLFLSFDVNGGIIPTETGETLGHKHAVHKTTATQRFFDHSHRMVLIDNDKETINHDIENN